MPTTEIVDDLARLELSRYDNMNGSSLEQSTVQFKKTPSHGTAKGPSNGGAAKSPAERER